MPVTSPHLPRLIEFGFVEEVAANRQDQPTGQDHPKE